VDACNTSKSGLEDDYEHAIVLVLALRPPMGDVKTALGCFFLMAFFLVASVPAFFLSVEQGKRR